MEKPSLVFGRSSTAMLAVLLTFALAFSSCDLISSITGANSDNGGGNTATPGLYFIRYGTGYSVAAGAATSGAVVIPAVYNGLPVTAIRNDAFRGKRLTSVTIPDSVASIGDYAFADNHLTSVFIPDSVASIGNQAFIDNQLTSVTIGNSVTSIGNGAFRRNSSLTNITVAANNSNYSSEGGVLYNKAKTEIIAWPSASGAVTIPAGVTVIGVNAFSNCTGLSSITIPTSVTAIGGFAFLYCTGLASISIPASVRTLGGGAFSYWTSSQTISVQGHANQAAADRAWGENWRATGARIVYGQL